MPQLNFAQPLYTREQLPRIKLANLLSVAFCSVQWKHSFLSTLNRLQRQQWQRDVREHKNGNGQTALLRDTIRFGETMSGTELAPRSGTGLSLATPVTFRLLRVLHVWTDYCEAPGLWLKKKNCHKPGVGKQRAAIRRSLATHKGGETNDAWGGNAELVAMPIDGWQGNDAWIDEPQHSLRQPVASDLVLEALLRLCSHQKIHFVGVERQPIITTCPPPVGAWDEWGSILIRSSTVRISSSRTERIVGRAQSRGWNLTPVGRW